MPVQLSTDEVLWEQEFRQIADGWKQPPAQPGKLALVWAALVCIAGVAACGGWVIVDMVRSVVGW